MWKQVSFIHFFVVTTLASFASEPPESHLQEHTLLEEAGTLPTLAEPTAAKHLTAAIIAWAKRVPLIADVEVTEVYSYSKAPEKGTQAPEKGTQAPEKGTQAPEKGTEPDIQSKITLNIINLLRNQQTSLKLSQGTKVSFVVPGGVVDNVGYITSEAPSFRQGERGIVLLEAKQGNVVLARGSTSFLKTVKGDLVACINPSTPFLAQACAQKGYPVVATSYNLATQKTDVPERLSLKNLKDILSQPHQ